MTEVVSNIIKAKPVDILLKVLKKNTRNIDSKMIKTKYSRLVF